MDSRNKNSAFVCSYSRDLDIRVDQLSEEEQREAEESLTVYCKPIELYNILQRRATKNVL